MPNNFGFLCAVGAAAVAAGDLIGQEILGHIRVRRVQDQPQAQAGDHGRSVGCALAQRLYAASLAGEQERSLFRWLIAPCDGAPRSHAVILCDKLAILDYLSDGGAALGSVVLDAGGTGAIQRIAFAQSLGGGVSVLAGRAEVLAIAERQK